MERHDATTHTSHWTRAMVFGLLSIVAVSAAACGGSTSNGADTKASRAAGAGYRDTRLCVRNFSSSSVKLRIDKLVDTGLDSGPNDFSKWETLAGEQTICASNVNEQGATFVTPKGETVRVLAWNGFTSSGINISSGSKSTGDIYTNPDDKGSFTLSNGERVAWIHYPDTDYKEFLVVMHDN